MIQSCDAKSTILIYQNEISYDSFEISPRNFDYNKLSKESIRNNSDIGLHLFPTRPCSSPP